jgi:hypothetical protein
MGDDMRKRNASKAAEQEWELDDLEPQDQSHFDRRLVLVKEPLPRKVQLMDAGVKEIRCVACGKVRPIAGAEELGDGWICEHCLSDGPARS